MNRGLVIRNDCYYITVYTKLFFNGCFSLHFLEKIFLFVLGNLPAEETPTLTKLARINWVC